MAKTLEEVKKDLYVLFNKAVDAARYPSEVLRFPEHTKAASETISAAANAANAIVNVEREIAERDAGKTGIKLPGK